MPAVESNAKTAQVLWRQLYGLRTWFLEFSNGWSSACHGFQVFGGGGSRPTHAKSQTSVQVFVWPAVHAVVSA
jgi:hypothetical protein